MIIGIGTDIVSVKRVEGIYQRHENFLAKIFTQREQEYFSKKGNKIESVSAGFAAKESVAKALGTGFRQFSMLDVEILHDHLDAPFVRLHGGAKELAIKKNVNNIKSKLVAKIYML